MDLLRRDRKGERKRKTKRDLLPRYGAK